MSAIAALTVAATVGGTVSGMYFLLEKVDNSYELTFAMNVNASDEEGDIRFGRESSYMYQKAGRMFSYEDFDPDNFYFPFDFMCSGKNVESVTVTAEGDTAIIVDYLGGYEKYDINGIKKSEFDDGTLLKYNYRDYRDSRTIYFTGCREYGTAGTVFKHRDTDFYSSVTLTPEDMSLIMNTYALSEDNRDSWSPIPRLMLTFMGKEPGGSIIIPTREETEEMEDAARSLQSTRNNIENWKNGIGSDCAIEHLEGNEKYLARKEKEYTEKYGRDGKLCYLGVQVDEMQDSIIGKISLEKQIKQIESGNELEGDLEDIREQLARTEKRIEKYKKAVEEYNALMQEYADEINERYKDISVMLTVNFNDGTSEKTKIKLHADASKELNYADEAIKEIMGNIDVMKISFVTENVT